MKCWFANSATFFKKLNRFSTLKRENLIADCPPLPCFFGKSTVILLRTSFLFPARIPKRAPFPSIIINPIFSSFSNKENKTSV
mmetsp:Transcript_6592/g.12802  ORF Transcript_6592/g.12802 Transcript_6592/m.12802 type:complete len:83 (+) Transcript_6592:1460-1708(+)